MDENGIIEVCEALGLSYGHPYPGTATFGPHISIACPLATAKHADPFDSNLGCSVMIIPDGPSGAKCWSPTCAYKGGFARLIRLAAKLRPQTPQLEELVKRVSDVERLTLGARHARCSQQIQSSLAPVAPIRDREILSEDTFADFANKVPRYAIRRGLTLESCKRWGLGFDEELGYLVFPVRRSDGKLIGMVGRSVRLNPMRRHHNYAGLDKSRHLFGAHLLIPNKPVVIVEGCVDAIKVDQALEGEACVVACLGEGFSQQHARVLSSVQPPAVYIFTDGDKNGRLMGEKIAHCLSPRVPLRLMDCPWGPLKPDGEHEKVDPDMLPPQLIRNLFRNAKVVLGGKLKWTEPPTIFDAKTFAAPARNL